MLDLQLAADLLVAALVGLAVGIEREWSGHVTGPDGRFAGARTFTLLGAIGGLAGWFLRLDHPALAAVAVGAGVVLPIVAWATSVRRPGATIDGTTETAAILVVLLGVAAGLGNRTIASAAGAVCVVLLAEKTALQQALQRMAPQEMRAAVQFAVLALVILPLLPDTGFGPYGAFRPRQLWTVVLLFSGLNFAGYIARRLVGETRGLAVTGLLGGLVSSTAVSLTFSKRSREEPDLAAPLALGVVAACTVLVPRLLVIMTMLQSAVAVAAVPVLAPAFIAGVAVVGAAVLLERRRALRTNGATAAGADDTHVEETHVDDTHVDVTTHVDASARSRASAVAKANGSPLGLMSALKLAIGFQLVLFAIAWVQRNAGTTGILTSAMLLGLTDMDALTVSMTRYAAEATADASLVRVAAAAIGVGVLANTVLKLALVVVLGSTRYRWRASAGLLALAAGSAIGLVANWP